MLGSWWARSDSVSTLAAVATALAQCAQSESEPHSSRAQAFCGAGQAPSLSSRVHHPIILWPGATASASAGAGAASPPSVTPLCRDFQALPGYYD
eukprot:2184407-Rhodomonas_salina.1